MRCSSRCGKRIAQRFRGVTAMHEMPLFSVAGDFISLHEVEPLRGVCKHASLFANGVNHDSNLSLGAKEVSVDKEIRSRVEDSEVRVRVVPANHARFVGAQRERRVHSFPRLMREGHAHLFFACVFSDDDSSDTRPRALFVFASEAN